MSKISEKRRNEILAAAAEELAGKSMEALSMSDIAARAGIGKSTIYEYFPSKNLLLLSVIRHQLEGIAEATGQLFSGERSFRIDTVGFEQMKALAEGQTLPPAPKNENA